MDASYLAARRAPALGGRPPRHVVPGPQGRPRRAGRRDPKRVKARPPAEPSAPPACVSSRQMSAPAQPRSGRTERRVHGPDRRGRAGRRPGARASSSSSTTSRAASRGRPQRPSPAVAEGTVGVVLQDMNFRPGATSGEDGAALFRALRRADPGAAGPPHDGLDLSRDRRRARARGRHRLLREALGRREARLLGPEPPAPAGARGRERARSDRARRVAGRARGAPRPARPRLRERGDAPRRLPRREDRAGRRAGPRDGPERRRQGAHRRDRAGELAARARGRSSR